MKFMDRLVRELAAPHYRARKLERQWYVTHLPHGPFPAGTECIISRARPDSFLVMEFADGSVAEVTWGFASVERERGPLERLFELAAAAAAFTDPRMSGHLVATARFMVTTEIDRCR